MIWVFFSKGLFRLFIFAFISLSFLLVVHASAYAATTYYVDPDITDVHVASNVPDYTTYDHTTFAVTGGSDSVYKTIADVNLKSFSAGDSILFKKGGTWNEQLNISNTGSSGSVITYDSYGAGADPIIDGQATRSYAISSASKSFITIQNIHVKSGTTAGIYLNGGTNLTVTNVETNSNNHGLYIHAAAAGIFTSINAHNNTLSGMLVDGTGVVTINSSQSNTNANGYWISTHTVGAVTINNSTATGNTTGHGFRIDGSAGVTCNTCTASAGGNDGFYVTAPNSDLTCNGCIAYNNQEDGISVYTATTGPTTLTCNYCKSYNNGKTGSGSAGDGYSAHDQTTLYLNYCVGYGNYKSGVAVVGSATGHIYNSTFYNDYESSDPSNIGIWLAGTGTWDIKNNITRNHTIEYQITGPTVTSDYNLFSDSRGGNAFCYTGACPTNWAGFKAASGQDTHSINLNPNFYDEANNDLHLTSTSPAINTGTNLSFSRDYDNNPLVGLPDIGAYEFMSPIASTSLVQYKSDGTTVISSGGWTNQATVVFKFNMSSTNSADMLTPQVELQQNGTAFTNTANHTDTAVAYSGSPVLGTVTVSGLSDGATYHWQAQASNSASAGPWLVNGGSPDFKVDLTAPTITSTGTTTISTEATITWITNEDSSSKVDYGLTNSYGSSTAETDTSTRVSSHSVTLSGLTGNCTTYHYRVRSKDAAGNEAVGSDNTFSTSGCPETSSPSNNSNAAPSCGDSAPTGTPDLFQINANDTQAVLYFSPVSSNVNKYYVAYGYTPGDQRFGVEINQGSSTGVLSYTIDLLSPNRTYYVRLRAGNGCMPGSWGNEMKITTAKKGTTGGVSYYKNFISRILSIFPRQTTVLKTIQQPTPKPIITSCSTYTVNAGDSLWSIAQTKLGEGNKYLDLLKKNNLKSSVIHSGQKIQVGC
jgi:LysM repeat protein